MIIPHSSIDSDTLYALVESFVLREGTDYGEVEVSLEQKVAEVIQQLERGTVLIEYSEEHESVNIIEKP
ncbi:YheU family protein [Glaciecola sp. MH2013]|uniref:YheU family protein n=1 Tax=Glaciecola sp. MH2013 TaxID=2785524 RepID=UPI00189DB84C|nr:YheU family protein [Glaciecola sp. MH2013]MBF7074384.1 YheU family protein [Glaciecola sp. MH2013]